MFSKILIANRGEIACRVIRTCRRLGIRTVAVYSEADADAQHVRQADEAYLIGGPRPADSYLRGDAVIAAAREAGAEAIHPGYGFLSENADFADAVAAAGLVFIGPSGASMRKMGSKAGAKELMAAAGVPVVPGYTGEDQSPNTLAREAARIGFPLMIKAAHGGGGKGMRVVHRLEDFIAQLESCQREAANAFGRDRVLLERYVASPRHIEIQVFADAHGHTLHLNERECSAQRRYQKVLEESPSPFLTPALRAAMGDAAVKAAQAIDYVNAGTVEFIVDPDGQFYFMEINTRLQVEHPVTELITGEDLVAWQLAVAEGRPLPKSQEQIQRHGAAMEVRLYAENPYQQFLPSAGRLEQLRWPAQVRVDSGFEAGDRVSDHYDPMIAKLISHGGDRDQARRRLVAALDDLAISGVHHNAAFLHRVLSSPVFADAELDTRLLEKHPDLMKPAPADSDLVAVAAAGAVAQRPATGNDPWGALPGWRPLGQKRTLIPLRVGEQAHTVVLDNDQARVDGGEPAPFHLRRRGTAFELHWGERRLAGHLIEPQDGHARHTAVFVHGQDYPVEIHPARESDRAGGQDGFIAPMSGTIVACHVAAGATVAAGDAVITLEAMKMEHTLRAGAAGTVERFHVADGDSVAEGTLLVDFNSLDSETEAQ